MSINNNVNIIGRIGMIQDIKEHSKEFKTTRITVATNEYWKNKKGEKIEKTTWHNVVLRNRLAELMFMYGKKGDLVAINGSIETTSFEDDSKKLKYYTQINCESFQLLEKRDKK